MRSKDTRVALGFWGDWGAGSKRQIVDNSLKSGVEDDATA
jgi:hypothetical protein